MLTVTLTICLSLHCLNFVAKILAKKDKPSLFNSNLTFCFATTGKHCDVCNVFKALLFIATGNVIHNSNDYQDMRLGGGNMGNLPFNQAVIVLTKLSLCGLPFFSAFYSKEFILESLSRGSLSRIFVFFRI